jgi:hypothetical protein
MPPPQITERTHIQTRHAAVEGISITGKGGRMLQRPCRVQSKLHHSHVAAPMMAPSQLIQTYGLKPVSVAHVLAQYDESVDKIYDRYGDQPRNHASVCVCVSTYCCRSPSCSLRLHHGVSLPSHARSVVPCCSFELETPDAKELSKV